MRTGRREGVEDGYVTGWLNESDSSTQSTYPRRERGLDSSFCSVPAKILNQNKNSI